MSTLEMSSWRMALGLSDAGAHVGMLCDAPLPTDLLGNWGVGQSNGEAATVPEPASVGLLLVSIAFVAAAKGYKIILTMPETMSLERRTLLALLGADLVLTPGPQGMKGAIAKAEEIVASTPNAFMPQQFENSANPAIHSKTTAEELWEATGGEIDMLVAAVGTGGTITGVSSVLKARKPGFKAIAVEPEDSPVISQSLAGEELTPGPHKIQGTGAGFIPTNLKLENVDECLKVSNDAAFAMARTKSRLEACSSPSK